MNESQANPNSKRARVIVRRVLVAVVVLGFLYIASFVLNTFSGGYWSRLERDGRDRWSMGLSMHTAVLWQPRFGYWTPFKSDWLGAFYSPLIQLDRRFLHPTRYISDDTYSEWFRTTAVGDWHPEFRSEIEAEVARISK